MIRPVAEVKAEIAKRKKEIARLEYELREATISEQLQRAASERKREVKKRALERIDAGETILNIQGRIWWGDEKDPIKTRGSVDEWNALQELAELGVVVCERR